MLFTIRDLYKPVQPSFDQTGDHVSYKEFLPGTRLQEFIYCYWQLKSRSPLTEQARYRAVADGCIDIIFELHDTGRSCVMGFCNKYAEFDLEQTFNYIGIRFLPAGFPQLFKVNAAELSNRLLPLDAIIPSAAHYIRNNIGPGQEIEEIINALNKYFFDALSRTKFDMDNRLYEAVEIILKNAGVIDVRRNLDTGISSRQLQRLFEYYIGDTAKTFSKVVRFQNILRSKPTTQSLRKNKLFYDAGYYDQAHFIKDFKNFYGVTPGQAFSKSAQVG